MYVLFYIGLPCTHSIFGNKFIIKCGYLSQMDPTYELYHLKAILLSTSPNAIGYTDTDSVIFITLFLESVENGVNRQCLEFFCCK